MLQYKVRSGQNIYDVALTLLGNIEGVFTLLACNSWLSFETELSYGMIIEYPENLFVDQNLYLWLKNKDIVVKNGNHSIRYLDTERLTEEHFKEQHPDLLDEIKSYSPDESSMFWESVNNPRVIIHQQGQLSNIKLKLFPNTHLIIDWGDYSNPQIVEGEDTIELEHCYKSGTSHIITLYGDFSCQLLDFTDLNGIYYLLENLIVKEFITPIQSENLNKLIISQ